MRGWWIGLSALDTAGSGPRWVREIERLSTVKPVLILSGNVRDMQFFWDDDGVLSARPTLVDALFTVLPGMGYRRVYAWDIVDGITIPPQDEDVTGDDVRFREQTEAITAAIGRAERPGDVGADSSDSAGSTARLGLLDSAPGRERVLQLALESIRVLLRSSTPTAVVVDFSSQLQMESQRMSLDERLAWIRLLKAGADASFVSSADDDGQQRRVHNLLVVVCDKINDLPTWLYYGNPDAAQVQVAKLEASERRRILARSPVIREGAEVVDELALATDGMYANDIQSLVAVVLNERARSRSAGAQPEDAGEIVRTFKFGERENPWDDPELYARVLGAEESLGRQVLHQDAAVRWMQDVLARAVLGTSGIQVSADRSKPRGVLFFAGHTGVGKTELAKATARLVFGKDAQPLRFDMSEYSSEFNAQRLIGAPPGYVGYEQGGQLTEAMKENPFQIILFDEVEKADSRVLDKFLQILEDGRLTDGQGNTVYFSESIIIFTSNAGTRRFDEQGNVVIDPDTGRAAWRIPPDTTASYEEVRRAFIDGVEDYFETWLGRPELLNRIGLQNIIVFDVLREEFVGDYLDMFIARCAEGLMNEQRVRLVLSPEAVAAIAAAAKEDLSQGMGGRGITNLVEIALLNPVSRSLLQYYAENPRPAQGEELLYEVARLFMRDDGATWDLELSSVPILRRVTITPAEPAL